jgi:Zn2+/Cd2+-exporting ATPase
MPSTSAAAFALAYLAGGWDAARRASHALRDGNLDIDLLMLVAAAGAAVVGSWFEGTVLLFLFSLGNTLETYAFHRTRRSIHALMTLRPDTAAKLVRGGEEVVAVSSLIPGDVVRARPGDRLPVDGRVVGGGSHVDESTLTGEAMPVARRVGDDVFAGTLNGDGSLEIEVTRHAHETTLARVIRMVEEARESRAPTQTWLERWQGRYAALVIGAAVVAAVLPIVLLDWTFGDAFYRAMTLLVVASPCALVISIPATIVSAVSNGARHGVLFKGGASLDALADVRVIALDKTGTVTRGVPELVGVLSLQGEGSIEADEHALLRLAAGAESLSEHPLARAVVKSAIAREIEVPAASEFRSHTGSGVTALIDQRWVHAGKREWVEREVGSPTPAHAADWTGGPECEGATIVFLAIDGKHAGALALADEPRTGVPAAIDRLRQTGVRRIAMLTGDDHRTGAAVARRVGIDEARARLLPAEKVKALGELRSAWGPIAMVGDGVNDAPALAAADVGIAIGAAGTDVALETADVVVMGEDLAGLVYARELALRARTVVRQNLVFASGVLVTLVILALAGRVGLTLGVIGHEGSTIIVVLNGLRLLRSTRRSVDSNETRQGGVREERLERADRGGYDLGYGLHPGFEDASRDA